MSDVPELPKVPFLSPRNVPLWGGVTLVVIVAAMIAWLG
jgi:hypothetical protein